MGHLEHIQYFNSEASFQKKTNLFHKTGGLCSTKIESATFLQKIVLPEANVKTNRMGSTSPVYL